MRIEFERDEMACIYQPPNAHVRNYRFAKQRNGGGGREKDLYTDGFKLLKMLQLRQSVSNAPRLVTAIRFTYLNQCPLLVPYLNSQELSRSIAQWQGVYYIIVPMIDISDTKKQLPLIVNDLVW
jgi:hypothetical protein